MAVTNSWHILLEGEKNLVQIWLKPLSHTHLKKVGLTSEHGATEQQLLNCFPLLLICPWEHPNHIFHYYWQYLSHKPCGKCAVLAKHLCGVWCWVLWGFFWLVLFLKKKKEKANKNPITSHIRAHEVALQSEPCLYRPQRCADTDQQPRQG